MRLRMLLHGGQLDASADESEEIHIEPPAYMNDFSCRSSATRQQICFLGLLWPRGSPSRLPASMGCSRRLGGGVSCRGRSVDAKGRAGRRAQIGQHVSAFWNTARSGARSSSFRRKSGVPSHTQEDLESEAPLQEGGWRSPARLSAPVCSMGLVLGTPSARRTSTPWRTRIRTTASERWRPGYVPASSQEVCRRLGILVFREAVTAFACTAGKCFSLVDGSLAVRCGLGLVSGAVLRH